MYDTSRLIIFNYNSKVICDHLGLPRAAGSIVLSQCRIIYTISDIGLKITDTWFPIFLTIVRYEPDTGTDIIAAWSQAAVNMITHQHDHTTMELLHDIIMGHTMTSERPAVTWVALCCHNKRTNNDDYYKIIIYWLVCSTSSIDTCWSSWCSPWRAPKSSLHMFCFVYLFLCVLSIYFCFCVLLVPVTKELQS